eukprot:TRINITY_DN887_c0_g1_i2.p1 TRINITY_DN887_c0_g1~~TRINITY_DN887_c0_g1_i2.p1  ORF type:complete len:182 (+),score=69.65 TRINITY_DN887_c0_g1_i2:104-649(+)
MVIHLIIIFLSSLSSALVAEGISWYLIYSTDEYKRLQNEIEKTTQIIEKNKDSSAGITVSAKQKQKKKLDRFEETLKTTSRELNLFRMKSTFAVIFSMMAIYSLLTSWFDGRVVAKLPFEPIGFIRGLTHRNLAGIDYYDCSFAFFYVLCSMAIRPNIQKFFGFVPRNSSQSIFGPTPSTS